MVKRLKKLFIRRLLENYCFVLLANKAPPQISDNRPDMRHRALFVTSRAAWRWNNMLLAREIVDQPLAAIVVATEHYERPGANHRVSTTEQVAG